MAGTSSALFNQGLARKLKDGTSEDDLGLFAGESDIKQDFIEEAYIFISEGKDDVATYENPFYKWDAKENPIRDLQRLHLVDAGEAEENIPSIRSCRIRDMWMRFLHLITPTTT